MCGRLMEGGRLMEWPLNRGSTVYLNTFSTHLLFILYSNSILHGCISVYISVLYVSAKLLMAKHVQCV